MGSPAPDEPLGPYGPHYEPAPPEHLSAFQTMNKPYPGPSSQNISVVIPCLNEEESIGRLVHYLIDTDTNNQILEVLVVDGGSTDRTVEAAELAGAMVVVHSQQRGRAVQMNRGASETKGDILYFVHADSFPPASYANDIVRAVASGYLSGCYRLAFDRKHWFLRLSCWFTRFNWNIFRFGDQSLFVSRHVFIQAGGFEQGVIVMEDQEIIARIRRLCDFRVLDNCITTSARKYESNGIFRLQAIFFVILALYKLGASQERLTRFYNFAVSEHKI